MLQEILVPDGGSFQNPELRSKALTVLEVYRRFHGTWMSRRDPEGHLRPLEPQAEQLVAPVTDLLAENARTVELGSQSRPSRSILRASSMKRYKQTTLHSRIIRFSQWVPMPCSCRLHVGLARSLEPNLTHACVSLVRGM